MKDIRKGNDIQYKWTVNHLAEVSGDKVVQLISCKTGEVQIAMTYSISGNVINGTFQGKDQKDVGAYRLLLLVNDGHDNMVTLDKVNAFNLTGVCNFGIVRGEDDSSIETVVLEFESEIQVNAGIDGGEQMQADWDETNTLSPAYIRNKPTIPAEQVNSDWNANSGKAKILNKPTKLSDFTNDIKTYREIPGTWDTSHSMEQLIASINADATAVVGMAYLGTVHLSDLPESMIHAELIIDIVSRLGNDGDKVIVFTFSSSNVSPYKWEYTSAYGALGTWRSWLVADDIAGKEDKMNIVSSPKTASFTATVGNYYFVNIGANGSVTITLTTPTDNSHLQNAVFRVTTTTAPQLFFEAANGISIFEADGYKIEADKIYEVNAQWNGANWDIASVTLKIQS